MLTRLAALARHRPERVAYVVAAAVTSAAGALGQRRLHSATKMALVSLLQAGLARDARQTCPKGLTSLLLGTTAAGVGDAILLPRVDAAGEPRRQLRLGAAAFSVQQVIYTGMLTHAGARPTARTVAPVAAVLLGLATLDTATEGRPDLVVSGYGALLGAMAATALSAGRLGDDARRWLPAGGAAFLASDALILVREQLLTGRTSRAIAQGAVLASYALAQALLVDGLQQTVPR